jgi:hypothetical protein
VILAILGIVIYYHNDFCEIYSVYVACHNSPIINVVSTLFSLAAVCVFVFDTYSKLYNVFSPKAKANRNTQLSKLQAERNFLLDELARITGYIAPC